MPFMPALIEDAPVGIKDKANSILFAASLMQFGVNRIRVTTFRMQFGVNSILVTASRMLFEVNSILVTASRILFELNSILTAGIIISETTNHRQGKYFYPLPDVHCLLIILAAWKR